MITFSVVAKSTALAGYILLALLTVWSHPRGTTRWFFFIYLLGLVGWQLASLAVDFTRSAAAAAFWSNLAFVGAGLSNVLFFPFARSFTGRRSRKFQAAAVYAACAFLVVAGLCGLAVRGARIGKSGAYGPELSSLGCFLGAIGWSFWGYALYGMIGQARRDRSVERRNRIRYPLLGAGLVILGSVFHFTPLRGYPIDAACRLINAGLVGYAVLRHRLLDMRVFLVRTLFYSLIAGILLGIYIGGILAFHYASAASGIVSILILTAVFLPLQNRLLCVVDRLIFRETHDYQRVLESFSRALTALRTPGELYNLILSAVAEVVRFNRASIMSYDEETGVCRIERTQGLADETIRIRHLPASHPIIDHLRKHGQPLLHDELKIDPQLGGLLEDGRALFEETDASLVIPILIKGRLIGILNLGDKLSGTMYDDADLRFLATVANQVATVMDNALMRQEITSRLSHQTLLFMLSETFRRSMDLDEVMTSVVQILSNFLMIEHCGLAYFENEKTCRVYAVDLLSREAAEGLRARQQEVVRRLAAGGDAEASGFFMQGDRWPAPEGSTGPLAYLPLKERDEILGILIVSSRIGGKPIQPQEKDLLQAACAMLSQGVMLHRTIANLVNMKRYNESILNSINEMGDTLIIIDLEGRIQSVNQATCLLLGYGEEELVGRPIQQLVPEDEELFQAEGLRRLVRYGSITSYELEYIDRQGNRIPMLFSGSLMDTPGQRAERIVGIARDITEHKRAEDMQKNVVMVKEIHHRIKNNLQVISSLLFLQSSYVRDRRTREMFIESRNRVRSMALIHEKLYRSRDLRGIDFKGYMDDLVQNLLVSFGIDSSSLDLELNIQNVTLNMDTAIPCGLIVNELVSNSLKHAFPAESGGNRISIQLRTDVETGAEPAARRHAEKTVKRFELVVADNGRGLPDSLDFRATPSLGLKLVCTLTEQLNGTLQLDRTGGTTFRVRFQEI